MPSPTYIPEDPKTQYTQKGDLVFIGNITAQYGSWSVLQYDKKKNRWQTISAGSQTAKIPKGYLELFGATQRGPGGGSATDIRLHGRDPWMSMPSSEPNTFGMSKSEANIARATASGALIPTQTAPITNTPKSYFEEATGQKPSDVAKTGEVIYWTAKTTPVVTPNFVGTQVNTDYFVAKAPSKETKSVSMFETLTGQKPPDVSKTGVPAYWNVKVEKQGEETLFNTTYLLPVKNPAEEAGMNITGIPEMGKDKIPVIGVSTRDIMKFGEDITKKASSGFETMGISSAIKSLPSSAPSFVENLLKSPGSLIQFGSAIPFAVEVTGKKIIENPTKFPEWAVTTTIAGGILTMKDIQADPSAFAGQLIGTSLIMASARAIGTKAWGVVRTTGKTYIPVESIGYDVAEGFPTSSKITKTSLTESFAKNTLKPYPEKMSITGKPPSYVPKQARLPTDVITGKERIMWTGWEKTPSGRFALEGGSSEIPGMYGAPIAEAYFTKVSGQMPNVLGFDATFIKSPSILHTSVKEMSIIPKSFRSSVESAKLYASKVPGGKAVIPLMKSEYEAVLPSGNILEIKQTKYFTKLGGLSNKHIFGTRVPIIEAIATGEKITGEFTKITKVKPSYYKPSPMFDVSNLVYSFAPSVVGVASSVRRTNITSFVKSSPISTSIFKTYGSESNIFKTNNTRSVYKSSNSQPFNYSGSSTSARNFYTSVVGTSRSSGKTSTSSYKYISDGYSRFYGGSSITNTPYRKPYRTTYRTPYYRYNTEEYKSYVSRQTRSYLTTYIPPITIKPYSKLKPQETLFGKKRVSNIGDFAYREMIRIVGYKDFVKPTTKRSKRK